MSFKKYDDEDGTEIALNAGVEISLILADGTRMVRHAKNWAAVPKRFLDGTVGGQLVAGVQLRDVALTPPRQIQAAQ